MNPYEEENRALKRTLHLLVTKAERNRDVLATFQAMELQLLSCSRLSDLLDMLLASLKEEFRLDCVQLLLFDPEHAARDLIPDYQSPVPYALQFTEQYTDLKRLYSNGLKPWLSQMDTPLVRSVFCSEATGTPSYLGSCALLPLVRQGVIIGSLQLGSRDPQRYSANVATDYISHMASIIAVCLENCISQETLRRLSIIDMLTKVNNRRSFDQELLREVSRTGREQSPLSCLFVDLDHFKQINDQHGHQSGDRVLRQSAQAIREKLRKTDLIARYGGEEFAVLLPGCDAKQAVEVAESIRRHVSARQFISEAGVPLAVTLSIGISTCPPIPHQPGLPETLASKLLAAADKGVYQAKRSGRNRVAFVPLQDQAAE